MFLYKYPGKILAALLTEERGSSLFQNKVPRKTSNNTDVLTHAITAYEVTGCIAPVLFTAALDGDEWLAANLSRFTIRKKPPVITK